MAKMLSPAAVEDFERQGFVFPVQVLTPDEVALYHSHCALLDAMTPSVPLSWRTHIHLHFRWAYELATHPVVLDAVEELLGPDIIVLSTIMFAKSPGLEFVSWHQDGRYLVRDNGPVPSLTVWIALTESSILTGCLRAIPGSHGAGPLPHRYTREKDNMLLRGETVDAEVDESQAVDMPLRTGQMSLHHVDTFHGSRPNQGPQKRIGFTVRYAHPRVASAHSSAPAVLARGTDHFGKYPLLQNLPPTEFSEGLKSLEEAVRRFASADQSNGNTGLRPD